MTRLDGLRNTAYVALTMVGLVTVATHLSLIWHRAVPDIDTDTVLARAVEGCPSVWVVKGMGDSAHPLGNALLQRYACQFTGPEGLSPASGWFILIGSAVLVVAALLVVSAHFTGAGPRAAAVAVAYVAMSPVLRTLSTRAEENWVGSALFLLTTMCILGFHRTRTRTSLWLAAVGVSTLALGLWHTQYVVVLAIGLVLWGLIAMIRPTLVGTTRPRVLMLAASMIPAVLALGALFGSGYAARVAYHKWLFSIFNPAFWEGVVPWCRNYVAYSSRWLTGWLPSDGMEEKLVASPQGAGFVVLGLLGLALLTCLVVLSRNSLLMAIAFGTLVLPFLYEPHNAERWDPAAIIIALALTYGAHRSPPRPGIDADAHHDEKVSSDDDTDRARAEERIVSR